jgi:lauroyl/myristoyl acyltransferase
VTSYAELANATMAAVLRDIGAIGQPGSERFANAYHLADANLRLFFPHQDHAWRKQTLADIFFQQYMTFSDQNNFTLIDDTALDDQAGVFATPDGSAGRIFCTFHVGSYRHLTHFLLRQGADVIMFVAGKTLAQQGEAYIAGQLRGAASAGWPGRLRVMNAEDRTCVLRAARALKAGATVIFYIDGNPGVGSNRASDSLGQVTFFGQRLQARIGIGYLSHVAQAPIVPAMCRRDSDNGLVLTTWPAIAPAGEPREDYARQTTQALYDVLAGAIAHRPGLWESWMYVEKSLCHRPAAPRLEPAQAGTEVPLGPLLARAERFALLRYPGQHVLLDKDRHSCVLLDEAAALLFQRAGRGNVPFDAGDAGMRHLLALGALAPGAC